MAAQSLDVERCQGRPLALDWGRWSWYGCHRPPVWGAGVVLPAILSDVLLMVVTADCS